MDYQYDADGRRTQMTVTGQSSAVTYAYDNDSRLTGITQGTTGVSFTYDAAGRRTSLTLPDGIVVNYGYDAASELTGLTYAESGNVLGNLTYAYDGDGRRIQMGGTWARSGMPNATTSTAAYNADNELTSWNGTALSYDANGNPGNGEGRPAGVQRTHMTVSDAQFASRTVLRDGTNTYTWNARNQLSGISGLVSASFEYDPFGRRQQKTINSATTDFLYDGVNPVQELSGGTVDANMLDGLGVDEYFQRADLLGTWDYLNDALGSTIALADPTGTVQTQYTYSPFGTTTTQGQSSSNSYQFTGRENDGDGLYYYRARYYDPMLARFVSQDPTGFVGGVNVYAYVRDNPANLTDLLGLCGSNAGHCLAQTLQENWVPLTLDTAGVGAGFLPGGDFAVAAAQAAVALGGGIHSALQHDSTGAGLNASSAFLAMATPAAKGIAQTVAQEGGTSLAERMLGDIAGSVPVFGTVVSGFGLLRDAYHAYQDYQACTAGAN